MSMVLLTFIKRSSFRSSHSQGISIAMRYWQGQKALAKGLEPFQRRDRHSALDPQSEQDIFT
jgi:hypothetical protein